MNRLWILTAPLLVAIGIVIGSVVTQRTLAPVPVLVTVVDRAGFQCGQPRTVRLPHRHIEFYDCAKEIHP